MAGFVRSMRSFPSNGVTKSLDSFIVSRIYSWSDVSRVHRIRNGVYQRDRKLISLLTDFGRINPCYPDVHGHNTDTILYTGSGRHGDQKLDPPNRALLAAVGAETAVPLFNKLSPGRWEFMGWWKVLEGRYIFDEKQNRMLWKFTLKREQS